MSDFLSNFNGDNYDRRKQEKEPREPKKEAPKKVKQEVSSEKQEKAPEPKLRSRNKTNEASVEIDPSYKKQKRKKRRWVILGAIAAVLALGGFYYQQTHVKVPNFIGKSLSDLQVWASENKIKTKIKESYDLAKDANTILAQEQK
ncbi:MAG: PASTA domain-containing protein, partial [Enterococcus sp.]